MASIFDTPNIINRLNNYDEIDSIDESLTLSKGIHDMANRMYENVIGQIKDFQDNLDSEHEVAVKLASFGQPVMLMVEDIGFQNPNLMYFYGTINGRASQLIQHMNQLNFILTAAKKADPKKPPHRIGFEIPSED